MSHEDRLIVEVPDANVLGNMIVGQRLPLGFVEYRGGPVARGLRGPPSDADPVALVPFLVDRLRASGFR
jgi:hypothetical protein